MTSNGGNSRNRPDGTRSKSNEVVPGVLREQAALKNPLPANADIPSVLPHEKVFPIQIGSELFRLSGASISSDGQYNFYLLMLLLRRAPAVVWSP